jgi:hypothetical protein
MSLPAIWILSTMIIYGRSSDTDIKYNYHKTPVERYSCSLHTHLLQNLNTYCVFLYNARSCRGRDHVVVGIYYLCRQYLSPLKLWVRIPLIVRCSRYKFMFYHYKKCYYWLFKVFTLYELNHCLALCKAYGV